LALSNPVLFCSGLLILWWGWIGFNCGSSYGISGEKMEFAARGGVGTFISSITAGLSGIIITMIVHKGKSSLSEVVGCVLAGLGEKI
jgi:ammonium transporter, Amt family